MLEYKEAKTSRKQQKVITEGTLIKVLSSPNVRVRIQDKEFGHLQEISCFDEPIIGVVTKTWGYGYGMREVEVLSSGELLLITTNSGLTGLEVIG